MVGIAKAYGQIRSGSGPWRTPFVVPLQLLAEPPAYVSIADGGTSPDLKLGFVPIDITTANTTRVLLVINPLPGKALTNIELRVALLKSGASTAAVDSGPLDPGESDYVLLSYRCPPGQVVPPEIRVELSAAPEHEVTAANPAVLVDMVKIEAVTVGSKDTLHMEGGMVSGPMVSLPGVRTQFNEFTQSGYGESPVSLRGINLDRLEDPPPAGATSPTSATYFEIVGQNLGAAPTTVLVDLRTPSVGDKPTTAPTVSKFTGGTLPPDRYGLRPGRYQYKYTYVHLNKNESGPSPASSTITLTAGGSKVRVTGIQPPPPPPNPDSFNVKVTGIRIYRTDPTVTVDPDSPDKVSGDDVLVGEIAPTETEFIDEGPRKYTLGATKPPVVMADLMVVRYASTTHMNLSGRVKRLDSTTTTRYIGTITNAPLKAKVTYQPGAEPRLLWEADAPTTQLDVGLPDMDTPFGPSLAASLTEVPTNFSLHWTTLGDEFVGISARAWPTAVGKVGVRMGAASPPTGWPNGESSIAADLTDAVGDVPASALIAISTMMGFSFMSGAERWEERSGADGRMIFDGQLTPDDPNTAAVDRTLRIRRRSEPLDPLHQFDLSAHALPDKIHAELRLPTGGPIRLTTATRMRWLRAHVQTFVGSPSGLKEVRAWLDDTTTSLDLNINLDTPLGQNSSFESAIINTAWPVRVGVTAKLPGLLNNQPSTVRADVVLPTTATFNAAESRGTFPKPGLTGRVALSAEPTRPLAVSANPQAKVLIHGDLEPSSGLRALTARVYGLLDGTYSKVDKGLPSDGRADRTDHHPVVTFESARANKSFRLETYERDFRIAERDGTFIPHRLRRQLAARTAMLPATLDATIALVAPHDKDPAALVGVVVNSSERWGEGRVWMSPSFPRTTNLADLGQDGGIGNITTAFDAIPRLVEFWNLGQRSVIAPAEVASDKFLPTVGPVGQDWVPGGALIRVNGSVRLDHIRLASFAEDRQACRTDDGADHRVRYSKWAEVLAPFVELKHTGGVGEMIIWSASEPKPVSSGSSTEPDPCAPGPETPDLGSAIGWSIGPNLTVSMAIRQYGLQTRSGRQQKENLVRWNSMQTGSEEWGGETIPCGVWELEVDLQMKDYANTVALYPNEGEDNPFGSWKNGPGTWRLRQRGALKVPLFLFFGPKIASGDAYMGNAPGGTGVALPSGIFSYIPPLYLWSYP